MGARDFIFVNTFTYATTVLKIFKNVHSLYFYFRLLAYYFDTRTRYKNQDKTMSSSTFDTLHNIFEI